MDKITSMKVFCFVAEHGNFRQAAEYFAMSPTMVGKHIKHLEIELGTSLIHRTTRKQTLTEAGNIYLHECQRILQDISDMESAIHDIGNKPQGRIKLNAPVTFGSKVLAPLLAQFLMDYPNIHIDLDLDNTLIDPYEIEADFIFRIGELNDSSLVARFIGHYHMTYCASPSYLTNRPWSGELSSLSQHDCLGFRYRETSEALTSKDRHRDNIKLMANNGEVLRQAALAGAGIILQPKILVDEDIRSGRLIEITTQNHQAAKPIHLVYRDKHQSLKNRTFIDAMLCQLRKQPLLMA